MSDREWFIFCSLVAPEARKIRSSLLPAYLLSAAAPKECDVPLKFVFFSRSPILGSGPPAKRVPFPSMGPHPWAVPYPWYLSARLAYTRGWNHGLADWAYFTGYRENIANSLLMNPNTLWQAGCLY